ncbi:MAG: hypothetical protein N3B13_00480 [Deltaproteobacteria bacterium]|nr:hypothetical protein [Deltaproteobacteria bacterium]
MKKIPIIIFAGTFFLFSACTDENSQQEFTDTQNLTDITDTLPDSGYEKVLLTTEINESGKIVETEGIKINIPAGAINTSSTIQISEVRDKTPYDNNLAGKIYKISNFPVELYKPVEITLTLDTSPKETSFIMLGQTNYITSLNTSSQTFTLLDAEVISNKIKGNLPFIEQTTFRRQTKAVGTFSTGDKETILVAPITNMISHSQNHFRFIYSPDKLGENFGIKIEKLNGFFEEAFSALESEIGLSFSKRKKMPIKVEIKELKNAEIFANAVSSKVSRNYDWIEINEENLGSSNFDIEFKVSAAHELFHLLQDLYDPSWFIGFTGGDYLWFKEASSVWFEKYILKDEKYCSSAYTNFSGLFMINGLFNVEESQIGIVYQGDKDRNRKIPQQHGYASSLFLSYLINAFNNNPKIMGNIWQEISKDVPLEEAIKNATSEYHWYWKWEDFIRGYFYPSTDYFAKNAACIDKTKDLLLQNASKSYIDNPDSDSPYEFKSQYFGMSSKPFYLFLRLKDKSFEPNIPYNLIFNVEGLSIENKVMIINENSKSLLGIIDDKNTELQITNLHTFDKGTRFLIVVINSEEYKENTTKGINIKATVKKNTGVKNYEWDKEHLIYNKHYKVLIKTTITSSNSFVIAKDDYSLNKRYLEIKMTESLKSQSDYIKVNIDAYKIEINRDGWDPASNFEAYIKEAYIDDGQKTYGTNVSKTYNPPVTDLLIKYIVWPGLRDTNTGTTYPESSGDIAFFIKIVNQ